VARFDRDPSPSGPIIKGFSAEGGFAVDGGIYQGLLLTPGSAHEWRPPPLDQLTIGHFEQVLGLQPAPEFLLLGTGPELRFPPRDLARALEQRGIGIEAMDSRAAARIWTVLRGEQRWIVAALMPL
jgi:uncharacterized protein